MSIYLTVLSLITSPTMRSCRTPSMGSCGTHLIVTLEDLAKGLNNKSQTDVIFLIYYFHVLGYEKAFVKVSYRFLLSKVKLQPMDQWLPPLQIKSRAGWLSEEFGIQRNIWRSTGPLLILIFTNDFPQPVTTATTRLFADVSAVHCVIWIIFLK